MHVDKLGTYLNVAAKAAFQVVRNNKTKERMNLQEVDLAVAEAGMQWDPNKWDGDGWDLVDSGKSDSSDQVLSVKRVWRKER